MASSTRELSGLSWQQAECTKPNKGLYPERAGKRALPNNERERRAKAKTKRLKELCPWPSNEEQNEVVVQSSKRKRGNRAPRTAPSQHQRSEQLLARATPLSSLGDPYPVLQAIEKKRSHADAADSEAQEARKAWGESNFSGPIPGSLPSQRGHTSTLSSSRHQGATPSRPEVPLFQGTRWKEPSPATSFPASPAFWTANDLLRRAIPGCFDFDNTTKTGEPVIRRKRSLLDSIESEVEEGLPSPKRQKDKGVVRLEKRPMRDL